MNYLKGVTTLALDQSACTGCGRCVEVCPRGVFVIQRRKAEIVERDACMECGACMKNCAFKALTVASGVGCASAIINGMLTGKEPSCGCGPKESKNGCC